jgi:transcription antitermination factor NusG
MADHWYIVQCNPNCERRAVAEIRRAGFRAHMPRLAIVRRHHRTKDPIIKRRPLMTGYVFMRFVGPENWYALRQCQGVKGVLYLDGKPYHMPRSDVAIIMRAQRGMEHEDGQTRSVRREMRKGRADVRQAQQKAKLGSFHVGMHVTVPLTAAERVLARIVSVTKKGTVKAMVETWIGDEKREMPVEFTDIDNLIPVDGERNAA